MKPVFFILFTLVISAHAKQVTSPEDNLKELKTELAKKHVYDSRKLSRITSLKSRLQLKSNSPYEVLQQLFDEYEYYTFDSAYVYGKKMLDWSVKNTDADQVNISKIKMASLLLHAGMFKETFDYLKEIHAGTLNKKQLYEYYSLQAGAYANLAIYNNDNNFTQNYNAKSVAYLDSAIALCAPKSFEMLFAQGNRQIISGQTNQEPRYFTKLLKAYSLTIHDKARIYTALAAFYRKPADYNERIHLLAQSAICDIRSSTKETLATLLLAESLFHHGDLEHAYLFIQRSRDDAGFYGNKLRKLKIESILPDIATQINLATQREKNKFLIYFLSISLITTIISFASFLIFIQLRKLKVKEQIIQDKNLSLETLNKQLSATNDKLREYATVNEKYIGYFFNIITGYILKLDRLKKNVERKFLAKRYTEISQSLDEINIKKERQNLFATFDSVFISIFPNFTKVFNSLLKADDQIWPKNPELLNTELRIFALIRLGVHDIQTIATILEYSANTVYVYKMRIKAKAIVSGDEFEARIMAVEAV